MKREFEYFFYENFDADKEAEDPQNPRKILGKGTDELLSAVAQYPAGEYSYAAGCAQFGETRLQKLIDCGVLRAWKGSLLFDSPIFLREDAATLCRGTLGEAASMVELLEPVIPKLHACCGKLENGFSGEENLYHILCGMVFDGAFFDYLSGMGVVAASRWHPSGLDYLTVIYEKCEELRSLSNGLLCSYNRIANDMCALQSFGDAESLQAGERLPGECSGGADKERLLAEVHSLIRTGRCDPTVMALLEELGYAKKGRVTVPVYLPEHRGVIGEIEAIVEECLGEVMAGMLLTLSDALPVTAVKHQVNRMEIANELYYIFFGSVNEKLVQRGYVAEPERFPGEGRYLKCIEVYQ